MDRVGERRVRSDKKKEVKPLLSINLKDAIYRLSYITHSPVKDVCEQLCIAVMNDRKIITDLSMFFIRDIRIDSTIYLGRSENKRLKKRIEGARERVTIKFKAKDYAFIYDLAYALDCSPSRVVAVLLEIAMQDIRIVNQYIKQHLENELTEAQMKELRNIMRYINTVNDTNLPWASLLSQIFDEVGPIARLKDAITEFLR